METLRWCIEWLERLEQEDFVAVNLRPEEDEETEYVPYTRPQVWRVLARIAADIETVAQIPLDQREEQRAGTPDGRAKRRRRLAAPKPKPKKRRGQEERAALRALLGLSPSAR